MVYMTNSDLSESIRIMTVPPKTIEIHVTENEFDQSPQPMDDSKLTDQHKTSSQAMMKIPTPLQSTYLPNVPEQPSHRYLLGATLSDKESDVKLSTSFNNKQRSKTKNVRNQNHGIQPRYVPPARKKTLFRKKATSSNLAGWEPAHVTSFPDVQLENSTGLIRDIELVAKEKSSAKILTIENKQSSVNSQKNMHSPSSTRFRSFKKIKLAMASNTSLQVDNHKTQLFIGPSSFKQQQSKQTELQMVGQQVQAKQSQKGPTFEEIAERLSGVDSGQKITELTPEQKSKQVTSQQQNVTANTEIWESIRDDVRQSQVENEKTFAEHVVTLISYPENELAEGSEGKASLKHGSSQGKMNSGCQTSGSKLPSQGPEAAKQVQTDPVHEPLDSKNADLIDRAPQPYEKLYQMAVQPPVDSNIADLQRRNALVDKHPTQYLELGSQPKLQEVNQIHLSQTSIEKQDGKNSAQNFDVSRTQFPVVKQKAPIFGVRDEHNRTGINIPKGIQIKTGTIAQPLTVRNSPVRQFKEMQVFEDKRATPTAQHFMKKKTSIIKGGGAPLLGTKIEVRTPIHKLLTSDQLQEFQRLLDAKTAVKRQAGRKNNSVSLHTSLLLEKNNQEVNSELEKQFLNSGAISQFMGTTTHDSGNKNLQITSNEFSMLPALKTPQNMSQTVNDGFSGAQTTSHFSKQNTLQHLKRMKVKQQNQDVNNMRYGISTTYRTKSIDRGMVPPKLGQSSTGFQKARASHAPQSVFAPPLFEQI